MNINSLISFIPSSILPFTYVNFFLYRKWFHKGVPRKYKFNHFSYFFCCVVSFDAAWKILFAKKKPFFDVELFITKLDDLYVIYARIWDSELAYKKNKEEGKSLIMNLLNEIQKNVLWWAIWKWGFIEFIMSC